MHSPCCMSPLAPRGRGPCPSLLVSAGPGTCHECTRAKPMSTKCHRGSHETTRVLIPRLILFPHISLDIKCTRIQL